MLSDALSGREKEVLRLVADGMSNEEIGELLFVSPNTIKVHLKRIAIKLGVDGRSSTRAASVTVGFRKNYLK